MTSKTTFAHALQEFSQSLNHQLCTPDGQWAIKGVIDSFHNIYALGTDTKLISKLLEIHLLPSLHQFAEAQGLAIVMADQQNYYPDLSFVSPTDPNLKFAVDIKTTYRLPEKPWLCNGFTLGSHGRYFVERQSRKNVQFPYGSYAGHFCLGVIYDRTPNPSDVNQANRWQPRPLTDLPQMVSAIQQLQFFVAEKWKIASDKPGSGNTANIGSIRRIADIVAQAGMFARLGESWFDDYWMNYGKIIRQGEDGQPHKITTLAEFVAYRGGDPSLVLPKQTEA
jgi:hypothetical protein